MMIARKEKQRTLTAIQMPPSKESPRSLGEDLVEETAQPLDTLLRGRGPSEPNSGGGKLLDVVDEGLKVLPATSPLELRYVLFPPLKEHPGPARSKASQRKPPGVRD